MKKNILTTLPDHLKRFAMAGMVGSTLFVACGDQEDKTPPGGNTDTDTDTDEDTLGEHEIKIAGHKVKVKKVEWEHFDAAGGTNPHPALYGITLDLENAVELKDAKTPTTPAENANANQINTATKDATKVPTEVKFKANAVNKSIKIDAAYFNQNTDYKQVTIVIFDVSLAAASGGYTDYGTNGKDLHHRSRYCRKEKR